MTNPQTEARAIAAPVWLTDGGREILTNMVATALAAKDAELAELRQKLFPHADANPIAGFSYKGFYFISDGEGIKELRRLENNANQIETWRRSFDENLAAYKARAERAEAQLAEANKALEKIENIQFPGWEAQTAVDHCVAIARRAREQGGK